MLRMMQTPSRAYQVQEQYFVIDSFDPLYVALADIVQHRYEIRLGNKTGLSFGVGDAG